MVPRYLSAGLLTGVVLMLSLLAPARGGDPAPRDLIALAPVLDSSDGSCRSLDLGVWIGDYEAYAPKRLLMRRPRAGLLRLRAHYRAPNRFSLLVCDATDGTPLAYCSGSKIFIYDPVGPTLYYSENAYFSLMFACTKTKFEFDYWFSLRKGKSPHRILVDFPSILSGIGAAADRVEKHDSGEFELTRTFVGNRPFSLTLSVDRKKQSPFTAADLRIDRVSILCFDRLALNDALEDEWFAFPAKERLARVLPLKVVTAEEDPASDSDTTAVIARASTVRSVVNLAGTSGLINAQGLSGVDWDRVKKNDKKYSKALRDLLPLSE